MGWIGTVGDITHIKQTEMELKQLNTEFEDRIRRRTAEVEKANERLKREITERTRTEEELRRSWDGLNNIAKHSKADEGFLSLRKTGQGIQLVIQDNGRGFVVEDILSRKGSSQGLGLDSMKERTELPGGTFTIESSGSGTEIQACWPL